MKFSSILTTIVSLALVQCLPIEKRETTLSNYTAVTESVFGTVYKPQAFIVNMFDYELGPWTSGLDMVYNISIPGLSPEYPEIHCVANYTICQLIAGEGEINAASSLMALLLSPVFDLTETYFLLNGIAGGSPNYVTIGSATFLKYAVQFALEYGADAREVPSDWPTGFVPLGSSRPDEYPSHIYGTEIFELNEVLRNKAMQLLEANGLANGTDANVEYTQLYDYPANAPPQVVACDTVTADLYWFGTDMALAVENYTDLVSNGTAHYCATQQEDNASLESLLRLAQFNLVDFNRIVVLRTISDLDRPPVNYTTDTVDWFMNVSQGGSYVAVENLVNAGLPFIQDVITHWDDQYGPGVYHPSNFVGDYFGTLGGEPDFGIPLEE